MRVEVALFWTTRVTLVPMAEEINTPPDPLPELVIVPVLLTVFVEIVMPLAVDPSFLSVRLPLPVMLPETVKAPFWLVNVVPPLLTDSAVETVTPELELFWVIPVTFAPTPPLINTLPDPLPELVIVPELLTVFEIVMPLGPVLLLLSIRLPVPVMPPEWVKTAAPLFASVSPPAPSVVAPEISAVPDPVPLVIVRAVESCVIAPERSVLLFEVAWSSVRLLFSATVPLKVVLFVTPVIERVPEEPERTVILFVCVPRKEDLSVALLLLLAVVSPSRIAPAPNAPETVPFTVPALIVVAAV